MSADPGPPVGPQFVRTDAAFVTAVETACARRALTREALAEQARVPLAVVHAIYRRAPVRVERVSAVCRFLELPLPRLVDTAPLLRLGRLLRERRNRAALTRKALGQLAKVSEGTIKFIETGQHVPSRKTCLRLLGVDVLGLQWSDLTPFIGEPLGEPATDAELPALLPEPSLSREMVLEQMLLTDQLRLHQYGVVSSPAGWRRLCWFCGARSAQESLRAEEASHLVIWHARACTGQLAEELVQRYPIIHELALVERRSRLTPTAQRLHRKEPSVEVERTYGCRRAVELGEQLAYAVALAASPYRSGMVAVLLWALQLGPWPLGLAAEAFTEEGARRLRAAAAEGDAESDLPAEFLHSVAETSAWLLDPQVAPPQLSSRSARDDSPEGSLAAKRPGDGTVGRGTGPSCLDKEDKS